MHAHAGPAARAARERRSRRVRTARRRAGRHPDLEQHDRADDHRGAGELRRREPIAEDERREGQPDRHLDRDEQRRRPGPDESDPGEEGGQRERAADDGSADDAVTPTSPPTCEQAPLDAPPTARKATAAPAVSTRE